METGKSPTLSPTHDIIVLGGSAGAIEAMGNLFRQLPASLPASILVAYHIAPQAEGLLHRILAGAGTLEVKLADDGEPIRRGVAYVCRPDLHLLVERGTVVLRHGPRENRWRPSIDSLFRSAAVAYGPRVIGVILSGMLDDGTAGLEAIKLCGGIAVVQDPHDATSPEMPQSALDNVEVDHRVPLKNLGALLQKLANQPAGIAPAVPDAIRRESRVSFDGVPVADRSGTQFICPDCGGPLHRIGEKEHAGDLERYRCMVGHAFSPESLLSNTTEALERTIWAAIRLFRQRSHLLVSQAERERNARREKAARHYDNLGRESLSHAARLQEFILSVDDRRDGGDTGPLEKSRRA